MLARIDGREGEEERNMSKQKLQAFQDLPLSPELCGSPSVGSLSGLLHCSFIASELLALQLSLTIPVNVTCGKKVEICFVLFFFMHIWQF